MKPEVDQILMFTADQIMTELAPNLAAQYVKGVAQLSALMTVLSAQEYDRAAEIRACENREMRAVFAALAPLVNDAALKARLSAAASTMETSLRISALNQANDALRDLLIGLHEHIETLDGKGERAAETRLWQLLKTFAGRRRLHLPPG